MEMEPLNVKIDDIPKRVAKAINELNKMMDAYHCGIVKYVDKNAIDILCTKCDKVFTVQAQHIRTRCRLHKSPCKVCGGHMDTDDERIEKYNAMIRPYNCEVVAFNNRDNLDVKCNVCGEITNMQSQILKYRVSCEYTPCMACRVKNTRLDGKKAGEND